MILCIFVGMMHLLLLLAAIDHNSHLHRKPLVTKDEKIQYNKVFSKRSNNWRISVVKEEKTYESWPNVTTKVLQKRKDDKGSILRSTPIPKDHPKKNRSIHCPNANTKSK